MWFYIYKHDTGELAGRVNDKKLALETAKRQAGIEAEDNKKHPMRVEDEEKNVISIFQ